MKKGPDVWVILSPEDMRFLNRGGSIGKTAETGQAVRISYFDTEAQQQTMDVELPDEEER